MADDAVKIAGKQVVLVRDGKALDPVTGLRNSHAFQLEDVVSNNRMRGEIDAALAALKLLNPDEQTVALASSLGTCQRTRCSQVALD
jgi:urea transport system permease protein